MLSHLFSRKIKPVVENLESVKDYIILPTPDRIFDLTERNFSQFEDILNKLDNYGYIKEFRRYSLRDGFKKFNNCLKFEGIKKYKEGHYIDFKKFSKLGEDEINNVILPLGFSRMPKFAFLESLTNRVFGESIGGIYFSVGMSEKNPFAFREESIYCSSNILGFVPEAKVESVDIGTWTGPDYVTINHPTKDSWRRKAIL